MILRLQKYNINAAYNRGKEMHGDLSVELQEMDLTDDAHWTANGLQWIICMLQ